MVDFDLTTFAGIAMAVTMAVQGLKKMFPMFMVGKEEAMAMFMPLALGVVSKLSGSFESMEWSNFIVVLLLGGMTSQVAYDKVVQPVAKAMSKGEGDNA